MQSVGYDLIIKGNEQLQSLDGLQALQEVGGEVWLSGNQQLKSTAAMESLEKVGELPGLMHSACMSHVWPAAACSLCMCACPSR